jgi:hypothetical protein
MHTVPRSHHRVSLSNPIDNADAEALVAFIAAHGERGVVLRGAVLYSADCLGNPGPGCCSKHIDLGELIDVVVPAADPTPKREPSQMKLRIKVDDVRVFRPQHGDGWYAEIDVEDGDLVRVHVVDVVDGKDEVVALAYIKVDSRTGLDIAHN